jgi:hypothetical protein
MKKLEETPRVSQSESKTLNTLASDQQSAQVVKQAIKDDQALAAVAKDIQVTVKEGDITLNGKVSTEQQENLAVNTAKAVGVVDEVNNHLEVTHKNEDKKVLLVASVILMVLFNLPIQASASGSLVIDRGHHTRYTQVIVDSNRYYYDDDGIYYTGGPGNYVVVQAPVGAVIYRPIQYEQVEIEGIIYYKYHNTYYIPSGRGYQVVNINDRGHHHGQGHGHDKGHGNGHDNGRRGHK